VREVPLTEGRGAAWSTVDFEAARRRAAAGDADTPPRPADQGALAHLEEMLGVPPAA
jgi:type VI secretion system protein ImpA